MSPQDQANLKKQYIDIYGKGEGEALYLQAINLGNQNGSYLQAYKNAMAPENAMGRATLANTLSSGGVGASSSTSAIANAVYESGIAGQTGLQEQQLLANESSQLLALTGGVAGDAKDEVSDNGGAWGDILGGIEAAAGVAMEFVPGLQVPGAALIAGGVGTIAGANGGGQSKGSAIPGAVGALAQNRASTAAQNAAGTPNTIQLETSDSTPGVIPLQPIQTWDGSQSTDDNGILY
jgi:hypothetical protein